MAIRPLFLWDEVGSRWRGVRDRRKMRNSGIGMDAYFFTPGADNDIWR